MAPMLWDSQPPAGGSIRNVLPTSDNIDADRQAALSEDFEARRDMAFSDDSDAEREMALASPILELMHQADGNYQPANGTGVIASQAALCRFLEPGDLFHDNRYVAAMDLCRVRHELPADDDARLTRQLENEPELRIIYDLAASLVAANRAEVEGLVTPAPNARTDLTEASHNPAARNQSAVTDENTPPQTDQPLRGPGNRHPPRHTPYPADRRRSGRSGAPVVREPLSALRRGIENNMAGAPVLRRQVAFRIEHDEPNDRAEPPSPTRDLDERPRDGGRGS